MAEVVDDSAYFGVGPLLDSAKQQLSSQFADTNKVFGELIRVNKILNQMEKKTFSKELGTLWERCQDRTLNQEIDDLVDKSREVASHPLWDIVQDVRHTIKELSKRNALTWENLQLIGLAKQLLAKTEGTFTKPPVKATVTVTLTSDEIIDIASDLYEIAGSIYHKRIKEGMTFIKMLSPEKQKRLSEHIEMLGGSYKALYIIDDSAKYEENCMLVIQGLIGLAKEVAGLNDLYPTMEEIEDTFGDLDRILHIM